ncbi:hypothetical protein Mycch_5165 [Mycolicibacterium chubuense NBB4]|uniref:SnoaL-like domain-containing protein n=1 Tax=Mycolicibacterium chubuense (strain NBB4) TaxID=710421 RepID=I4BRE4_MYCCN|nr:hypothetical protein [Mycolicibacterium chubuense]AFM19851.1 hypothetical protein Mycch_5165 [Mycolicibacterium chubuense NBB4]
MTSTQSVEQVIEGYSGRARIVLEYSVVTKRLVDAAKEPGFSKDGWAPLAELVDVENFDRVGPFKEVMTWSDYVDFLTNWATSSEWECSFKRVTEVNGTVFLELEERSRIGDFSNAVNSVSVYEFGDDDRIRHIDVYLQMEPPQPEMLKSLEGIDLGAPEG